MRNETPDSWIERQEPEGAPNHEDACMVCDKIECECPPECEHCGRTEHPMLQLADRVVAYCAP
jgi:hypothetical protein